MEASSANSLAIWPQKSVLLWTKISGTAPSPKAFQPQLFLSLICCRILFRSSLVIVLTFRCTHRFPCTAMGVILFEQIFTLWRNREIIIDSQFLDRSLIENPDKLNYFYCSYFILSCLGSIRKECTLVIFSVLFVERSKEMHITIPICDCKSDCSYSLSGLSTVFL